MCIYTTNVNCSHAWCTLNQYNALIMNSLGLQTYVELFHFPSLAQSNVFNLTYMQSGNARRLKNNSRTYDVLVAFFRPGE
ncbi:hypothetical protein MN116_004353 [Schistosoma mekongi]|uniref:Uncharacterized protein n=1 Tax=Schistosoma mekongi TaxID=38744 RepID=A0AAE1ZGD0_SCHME|nr:hypothetical protein MN116_004353 [Schistosoma mekongi]